MACTSCGDEGFDVSLAQVSLLVPICRFDDVKNLLGDGFAHALSINLSGGGSLSDTDRTTALMPKPVPLVLAMAPGPLSLSELILRRRVFSSPARSEIRTCAPESADASAKANHHAFSGIVLIDEAEFASTTRAGGIASLESRVDVQLIDLVDYGLGKAILNCADQLAPGERLRLPVEQVMLIVTFRLADYIPAHPEVLKGRPLPSHLVRKSEMNFDATSGSENLAFNHFGTRDSELLHAMVQRRTFHAQASRRSSWTADDAVGLLQGPRNEFALGIPQSGGLWF